MYDEYNCWNDEDLYEDRYAPCATEAEAHAEWHRNAGVPMDQPGCPWDCCDAPYEDERPNHLGLEWVATDWYVPAAPLLIADTYVPRGFLPPLDSDDIPF